MMEEEEVQVLCRRLRCCGTHGTNGHVKMYKMYRQNYWIPPGRIQRFVSLFIKVFTFLTFSPAFVLLQTQKKMNFEGSERLTNHRVHHLAT